MASSILRAVRAAGPGGVSVEELLLDVAAECDADSRTILRIGRALLNAGVVATRLVVCENRHRFFAA